MKQLLSLLFLCSLSFMAEAQTQSINAPEGKQDPVYQNDVYQNKLLQSVNQWDEKTDTLRLRSTEPYYLVNPKPGVHRLPQDNMPCIVPDRNATVAIPNGWKGKHNIPFRGAEPRMPNPAKPLLIRPERPLLTYPDKENTK